MKLEDYKRNDYKFWFLHHPIGLWITRIALIIIIIIISAILKVLGIIE